MNTGSTYDVAVIGGGLAGLALAIQLARKKYSVLLLEKETYPFHRVCGEYVSMESAPFLAELGIDAQALGLPLIRDVEISDQNGRSLRSPHPMGGLGISRWLMDHQLAGIAREAGVVLLEATKVNEVEQEGSGFRIEAGEQTFRATVAAASFGKRSNLDVQWKRRFIVQAKDSLSHFIGIKYHLQGSFPEQEVQLHLFEQGYAGLVRIEEGLYNFCYLTTAENLKSASGSIEELEERVLCRNPRIREILHRSSRVHGKPVTISQISFQTKGPVERGMLMLGDAAGMITPLCGNGMSMALHSGKMAFEEIDGFFTKGLSADALLTNYANRWNGQFRKRLKRGRMVQAILYRPRLASALLWLGRVWPVLARRVIRLTHGPVY